MKIINELLVNDIKQAIDFYVSFLGFEICDSTGCPIDWVRLTNGSSEIMIEEYKSAREEFVNFPPKEKSSNLIKFKFENLSDVETLYARATRDNIPIFKDLHQTDYGTTEFAVLDCDENILILSN